MLSMVLLLWSTLSSLVAVGEVMTRQVFAVEAVAVLVVIVHQ